MAWDFFLNRSAELLELPTSEFFGLEVAEKRKSRLASKFSSSSHKRKNRNSRFWFKYLILKLSFYSNVEIRSL